MMGDGMMHEMMGGGMMWGMGFLGLLLVVALVLAILAMAKFILGGGR
jgi:hypothetical protein